MTQRSALVLGGGGLVGARTVAHLAEAPLYDSVTCLVRRPGSVATTEKVREQVVDFAKLKPEDVPRADDLYCAIGTTMKKAGSREAFRVVDHDIPLEVAKLATLRGAKRMALVSSVGADARSSNFYLRTKGELEEELGRLSFEALHIMRPSLLLGERNEKRTGEAIASVAMRGVGSLFAFGLRRYRPIEGDVVARAMVGALAQSFPQGSRTVHEFDDIVRLAASTERLPAAAG